MKKLSRRKFLKSIGIGAASLTVLDVAGSRSAEALLLQKRLDLPPFKLQYAEETPTICCYCGVGCGIIIHTRDGKVIGCQGDPDHPINEGALCSKGQAITDFSYVVGQSERKSSMLPNPRLRNERRITKILYRAPHSGRWEEKTWDWALAEIAKRVKATRDATFEQTDTDGVTVNRTQAISLLGSATVTTEENYLMQKMMRSIGVLHLDHCARL
jgi:formate dehydrogenase major subunit